MPRRVTRLSRWAAAAGGYGDRVLTSEPCGKAGGGLEAAPGLQAMTHPAGRQQMLGFWE